MLGQLRAIRHVYRKLSLGFKETVGLVALVMLYAVFESVGIGLLYPVFDYLEKDGVPESVTSGMWGVLSGVADGLGIRISLAVLLFLAFVPILLRQVVYYSRARYAAVVQQRVVLHMRSRGFSRLVHADLAFVEGREKAELGALLTYIITNAGLTVGAFVNALASAFLILAYVTVLAVLSWRLAIVAVATVAVVGVLVRRIIVGAKGEGRNLAQLIIRSYTAIAERIAAIRLVKMRAREDEETLTVDKISEEIRDTSVRIEVGRAAVEIIADPALMISVFTIVYLGVTYFDVTLAGLGLFMFILLRLNVRVKEINMLRQQLSALIPSLDAADAFLAASAKAATIAGGAHPFERLDHGIVFEGVGFSYGVDSEPALVDVNVQVPRGTMVAVVGRSGAGKSTLVDLIPRLRVPTEGSIQLGGVPIEEFDLVSLRRGIGFMTQEPMLFSGTIAENLSYGLDRDLSEQEYWRALEDSFSAEFVRELPEGLETHIGEGGVGLSGGQKQRLALARVFLQQPEILILDEPTSSLDSASEKYIQQALEKLAGRTTVIVIAHRLSTVQKADVIYVLDKGRVVQDGKHDELILQAGVYRELFEAQVAL